MLTRELYNISGSKRPTRPDLARKWGYEPGAMYYDRKLKQRGNTFPSFHVYVSTSLFQRSMSVRASWQPGCELRR
eukprot:1079675-Amorphochlora_amoeboformis.AAC.1